jgi:predicted membrane protein
MTINRSYTVKEICEKPFNEENISEFKKKIKDFRYKQDKLGVQLLFSFPIILIASIYLFYKIMGESLANHNSGDQFVIWAGAGIAITAAIAAVLLSIYFLRIYFKLPLKIILDRNQRSEHLMDITSESFEIANDFNVGMVNNKLAQDMYAKIQQQNRKVYVFEYQIMLYLNEKMQKL